MTLRRLSDTMNPHHSEDRFAALLVTQPPQEASMPRSRKTRLALLASALIVPIAGAGAWAYRARTTRQAGPSNNAIMVLTPYWYKGTWVFDDPDVGLRREP